MKNALLSTAVAGSVFLMSLGVSGSAMASDRYQGHHGYSGSHYSSYGGHSNRHYRRSYRRHHNNEGAALAFGLVFGSILGHAVSSNQTRAYSNTGQAVEVVPQYRYSH